MKFSLATTILAIAASAVSAANIPTVATENGSFTTLVTALSTADLVDTLSGDGPFTVFAPTDDAFKALPEELVPCLLLPENKAALTSILTYHVAIGKVMAGNLTDGMTVETLEGSTVTVDLKDGVKINTSKVVSADVAADNGVIHAVDAVLVPLTVNVTAFLDTCAPSGDVDTEAKAPAKDSGGDVDKAKAPSKDSGGDVDTEAKAPAKDSEGGVSTEAPSKAPTAPTKAPTKAATEEPNGAMPYGLTVAVLAVAAGAISLV